MSTKSHIECSNEVNLDCEQHVMVLECLDEGNKAISSREIRRDDRPSNFSPGTNECGQNNVSRNRTQVWDRGGSGNEQVLSLVWTSLTY